MDCMARGTIARAIALSGMMGLACGETSSSTSGVSAIAVSPDTCAIGRANSIQLSAVATLRSGSKQNITSSADAQWSTGRPNTATVDAVGKVVGANAGVTAVVVSYLGANGSVDCIVGP
jgi:hypothetical protein